MLLEGKVVIVSGIGPGLGMELSTLCAREGAEAVVLAAVALLYGVNFLPILGGLSLVLSVNTFAFVLVGTVVAFLARGKVREWVLSHLPAELVEEIAEADPSVRYLDYDWSLNDR